MKLLASRGVSSAAYKKIFTQDVGSFPTKIKKLVDQISARIRDGRDLNLKEWRAFWAVDLAYDVPFNQTTPTIVNHLLSKKLTQGEMMEELEQWGLSKEELFLEIQKDGKQYYSLNVPVFFQVYIPLVKAYASIRLANLFNARNSNPFLEYKPLKENETDSVLCEITTDLIDNMSRWYGYPAVLRQGIHQMLKYGTMLMFPREEWHCERQLAIGDNGEVVKRTQKEGLRYVCPHPTRMYYDLKYPLTSINTDTGIDFAGHWHVTSYGEILDNPMYWNRKHIFSGTNWFRAPGAMQYFREVFPCRMNFPIATYEPTLREDKAGWYTSAQRDQSVFITEHFERIVPREWGLGDYRHPVWHRFTMAGDDTVIWAEPCAYIPPWFMGWDYDENASRTSSFALECVPWQDQLGNVLSQMLLTAKQNLSNTVFYDSNLIDASHIMELKNLGETRYRATQYIPFDSIKTRVQGLQPQSAFQQPRFDRIPITELLQLIPTILNIMERVLQISAQEVGTQGTHQQSKFELQQMGGASSNRLYFTLASVDEGIDAWKRQLFTGAKAYMDPDFEAQVSRDIPQVEKLLETLGFTVKHIGKEKIRVEGSKSKLRLEEFARSNEGMEMMPDKEAAQVLFSTIGTIAGQPDLHQAIGGDRLLTLIEFAAHLAGAPRGFKIRTKPGAGKDQQVPEKVMEAIQAAQKATMGAIEEKLAKPIAQEMGQDKQRLDQLEAVVKQLEGIFKIAQAANEKTQVAAREAQSKEEIRQAEFTAEERRRQEKHQLDMKIEQEKAQADLALKTAEHGTDLAHTHQRHTIEMTAETQKKQQEIEHAEAMAKAKAKPVPA